MTCETISISGPEHFALQAVKADIAEIGKKAGRYCGCFRKTAFASFQPP
jgi:hypothetical protein